MIIKRFFRLITGLFLYALGITLTIQANMGVSPWDVFHQGLANVLNVTFGIASIFTGLLVVVINVILREKIGLGTVLNMLLIGIFIDIIFWISFVPKVDSYVWGFIMMTAGMITIAIATWLYVGAGLGSGPRDGLMIAMTKKTGFPVGTVRGCIECLVLVAGFALGGQVGLGTAFMAFGIGPIIQLTFRILRFNVKDVKHTYINLPSYPPKAKSKPFS